MKYSSWFSNQHLFKALIQVCKVGLMFLSIHLNYSRNSCLDLINVFLAVYLVNLSKMYTIHSDAQLKRGFLPKLSKKTGD